MEFNVPSHNLEVFIYLYNDMGMGMNTDKLCV